MRKLLSGLAALVLICGAAPATAMSSMSSMSMMPKCAASNAAVWAVPAKKMYYAKGSAWAGKGKGMWLCRSTATSRGYHSGMAMGKSGSMMKQGSSMSGGSMSGGMSGGSTSGGMSGGAMPMPRASAMTSPNPQSSAGATKGNPLTGDSNNTGSMPRATRAPNTAVYPTASPSPR